MAGRRPPGREGCSAPESCCIPDHEVCLLWPSHLSSTLLQLLLLLLHHHEPLQRFVLLLHGGELHLHGGHMLHLTLQRQRHALLLYLWQALRRRHAPPLLLHLWQALRRRHAHGPSMLLLHATH